MGKHEHKHDDLGVSDNTASALVESLRAIKYMTCLNCGRLYNNSLKTHKRLFGGCKDYAPAGEHILTPAMVKLEVERIKSIRTVTEIDDAIYKILNSDSSQIPRQSRGTEERKPDNGR